MKVKWKILLAKTTIFIILEIILNSLNLDTIATYTEFVFEQHKVVVSI